MVGEAVAVGSSVGDGAIVAMVSLNGVAVGVGVLPIGSGVGIGSNRSGEIVGGMLPSAGFAHAKERTATSAAAAIANLPPIGFILSTSRGDSVVTVPE